VTGRPLIYFEILSKHLRSLGADVRLGARLMLRRWRQLGRAKRSRIELGAVFSLLPLSAALAAIAAAPAALDLDDIQSRPIVEVVSTPRFDDQLAPAPTRGETFVREARVQRGELFGALLVRLGIDDEEAARFLRTDPAARPLLRSAPGRFVQASIGADGRLDRVHPHDPSWQNWALLEIGVLGNIVPDFPLINKSFNLSYSGADL